MRTINRTFILIFLALFSIGSVLAQSGALTIPIADGNPSARPIAVVPFAYDGANLPPATDLAQIISNDLTRSGQFYALKRPDIVEFPTRASEVKYPTWTYLKQDYLVVGRISDVDGGGLRIEFELLDVLKQSSKLRMAINTRPGDLRGAAHQIADLIYESITGVRGAFWTRIAYITAQGVGKNTQYALMVADSDGFDPKLVVRSREPLLSPTWSPDGKKLAYVSFERGNSSIFIQELSSGSRQVVASYRGINGAPAFSPDGSKLALTLSMSGNPEIYTMDLATRRTTQITKHFSIDTEPQWSADGQNIYFTSDRAGKPQIYSVPVSGGDAARVTFQGEYNAKVSIGMGGDKLAMAQGTGNVYRIAVLDRTRGAGLLNVISPGSLDESPSFAPNASMILYASREGRRGVLYAVSTDGRVRQRLVLADGDVREPSWGPFRQR